MGRPASKAFLKALAKQREKDAHKSPEAKFLDSRGAPQTVRALAEHYSLQVVEVQRAQPTYVVGLLGIINGLIGHRDGVGYIVARFDDETNKLEGFSVTTDAQRQQLKGVPVSLGAKRGRRKA